MGGKKTGFTIHPTNEIQLVPTPIINSCSIPPRLTEISHDLPRSGLDFLLVPPPLGRRGTSVEDGGAPVLRQLGDAVVERSEALIAEPATASVLGRELVNHLPDPVEHPRQLRHQRRQRVGHLGVPPVVHGRVEVPDEC